MSLREKLGLKLLHQFDPEHAHGLSIQALKLGLAPLHGGPVHTPRLETSLGGMTLRNPVGLGAGYDKNAEALAPMAKAGFGFWKWVRPPRDHSLAIQSRGCFA